MIGWLALGVFAMNAYALLLIWLRSVIFRTPVYRPMLLNVALSVAPLIVLLVTLAALLSLVFVLPSPVAVWALIVVGGAIWLLLLPNAGYLITELNMSHRRENDPVPLWYDIVAVLTLTMSGVLNTLANVILAEIIVAVIVLDPNDNRIFLRPWTWIVAVVVLLLVSFGIYLGRYLRFNSWDLKHPVGFTRKLIGHFRERGRVGSTLLFCALHTIFFMIVYLVVVAPVAASLAAL